jgi:hypothetical protein
MQALQKAHAEMPETMIVRVVSIMEMLMMGMLVMRMVAPKRAQMLMGVLMHAVKVKVAVFVATAVPVSVVSMHDRSFAIHILRYI